MKVREFPAVSLSLVITGPQRPASKRKRASGRRCETW